MRKGWKRYQYQLKVLLFSILYLPPVQAPCVPGMLTQAGAPLSRNSNKLRRSWYSSSSWLIQNLSLGDFTSFANLDFGHLWWEVSEVREPKKSLDAILGDNNSGKCPWHARPKATSEVSALGTFMCQDSPKPLQKKIGPKPYPTMEGFDGHILGTCEPPVEKIDGTETAPNSTSYQLPFGPACGPSLSPSGTTLNGGCQEGFSILQGEFQHGREGPFLGHQEAPGSQ
jgi:hypothetical protein